MRASDVKKNAAPWFVLMMVSLALATSPALMHSCLRTDALTESPPLFH